MAVNRHARGAAHSNATKLFTGVVSPYGLWLRRDWIMST